MHRPMADTMARAIRCILATIASFFQRQRSNTKIEFLLSFHEKFQRNKKQALEII